MRLKKLSGQSIRAQQPNVPSLSRRSVLGTAATAAALIAMPDKFSTFDTSRSASAEPSHFFIYGFPLSGNRSNIALQAISPPQLPRSLRISQAAIDSNLSTTPLKSPDGKKLAILDTFQASDLAVITIVIIDTASARTVSSGKLVLPGIPAEALLLLRPTFSANSKKVALVVAISVPADERMVQKQRRGTASPSTIKAYRWSVGHALAYFDCSTKEFIGPFYPAINATLPAVSLAASATDLFIWSLKAATRGGSHHSFMSTLLYLTVFPLGSGRPRFSMAVPGQWPSGEPIVTLDNGEAARLIYCRDIAFYSPIPGQEVRTVSVPALAPRSAKPGAPLMSRQARGRLLVANPVIGQAVVLDLNQSLAVLSEIAFTPPSSPRGFPTSKLALSSDGKVLYVLAPPGVGGLIAYGVSSGRSVATYTHGEEYLAVYQLPSGVILAIDNSASQLNFFTPSLTPVGHVKTKIRITAVF